MRGPGQTSHGTLHPARLKPRRSLFFYIAIVVLQVAAGAPKLRASFSQAGVWGTVTFERGSSSSSSVLVHVRANLSVSSDKVGDYSWGIYPFPIDYSRPDGCDSKQIGRKPWISLDATLGKLSLGNEDREAEDHGEEATTLEAVTGQPEGKKERTLFSTQETPERDH